MEQRCQKYASQQACDAAVSRRVAAGGTAAGGTAAKVAQQRQQETDRGLLSRFFRTLVCNCDLALVHKLLHAPLAACKAAHHARCTRASHKVSKELRSRNCRERLRG